MVTLRIDLPTGWVAFPQMPEIVFKKDQFHEFRATLEIALGGIRPQTGYRTTVGEVVEFDGFKLRLGSGESIEAPHIRAAINAGWFVPHDGSARAPERVFVPEPAQAPAPTPRTPVVRYEDQIVSSRSATGFKTETGAADRILGQLNQLFPNAPTPPAPAPAAVPPVAPGGRRAFALTRQEEFEGEGIPIKSFRPKAQEVPQQVGAEGVFEDQRSVTNINPSIQTKAGVSLEESAQVHKGSTDSVIMGQAAVVGTNKDSTPQQVRKMTMRTAADEGVPVARLRTPTSFGSTQINGSTSIDSAIQAVERQARVVPGTVEHAQPWAPPAEATSPSREDSEKLLQTLRWMVPGFAWDKDRPPSVRLAEAETIADPMMRRAILAYETPEMVADLQKLWGI